MFQDVVDVRVVASETLDARNAWEHTRKQMYLKAGQA